MIKEGMASDENYKNSYVFRDIEHDLEQEIEHRGSYNNVILIEGPRQVGKTTLVEKTLGQLKHPCQKFNLEASPDLAHKIDACPNFERFTEFVEVVLGFPIGEDKILFLDEAQESTKLGQFVRFMKEEWPRTLVILSGSIMSHLFRHTRYPVGRVTPLHVQPFSFKEFVRAVNKALVKKLREAETIDVLPGWGEEIHTLFLSLLEQYLEVGGLPGVVTHYCEKKTWGKFREDLLYGYYQDFRRVYGESAQIYLTAVLKTTAHLLAMPFKNSHVAALLDGGKNQKIIEAISQLEAWRMILGVEQRSTAPETHFHPKRYLFDIGIARQLRETALPAFSLLNAIDLGRRQSIGGVVENVVANSLAAKYRDLSGWKKSSGGSEIDFVIKKEEWIIPVECKAALKIKDGHLHGVRDFLKIYGATIGVIIGLAPFEIRTLSEHKQIIIIPLYLIDYLDTILEQVLKKLHNVPIQV